jgi:hypothetical protein
MRIHTHQDEGTIELIEAVLTQSIDDYKLFAKRGWLKEPFTPHPRFTPDTVGFAAVSLRRKTPASHPGREAHEKAVKEWKAQAEERQLDLSDMTANDLEDLLAFLQSPWLTRLLQLADKNFDGPTVRNQLRKIHRELNPKRPNEQTQEN